MMIWLRNFRISNSTIHFPVMQCSMHSKCFFFPYKFLQENFKEKLESQCISFQAYYYFFIWIIVLLCVWQPNYLSLVMTNSFNLCSIFILLIFQTDVQNFMMLYTRCCIKENGVIFFSPTLFFFYHL